MKSKIVYNTGEKIGNCVFISETLQTDNQKIFRRQGIFECSCGKHFKARISHVKSNWIKSCGCLQKQAMKVVGIKKIKHGKSKHQLFGIWRTMIQRCQDKKSINYPLYGGRGITVCDRWKDINNFLLDMYPTYQEGLELDRINVNGNYEPDNCRWITRKQNMNNTRRNRYIEYNGIIKTVSEWSDELNIPYKRLLARLNNWDVEKSFTYKKSNNELVR